MLVNFQDQRKSDLRKIGNAPSHGRPENDVARPESYVATKLSNAMRHIRAVDVESAAEVTNIVDGTVDPFDATSCLCMVPALAVAANSGKNAGVDAGEQEEPMARCLVVSLIGIGLSLGAHAQNIPDPAKVAPEYRDYAQKRRAELIKRTACTSKATKEKVLRRDLAAYVVQCVDAAEKAEPVETGARPNP